MQTKTTRLPVVGVFYRNNNGTSRQDIIRKIEVGEPLELVREPSNMYDTNAVMVRHELGQIGYVDRDSADAIAPRMDAGETFPAQVAAVDGRHELNHAPTSICPRPNGRHLQHRVIVPTWGRLSWPDPARCPQGRRHLSFGASPAPWSLVIGEMQ